jgi:hypothetical protein
MKIPADDAAVYARLCHAWYGGRGIDAWTKVAVQPAKVQADADSPRVEQKKRETIRPAVNQK